MRVPSPLSKQRRIEPQIIEGVSEEGEEGRDGTGCSLSLHPSCGLVQEPFVPIVLHNLFSPSTRGDGAAPVCLSIYLFIYLR